MFHWLRNHVTSINKRETKNKKLLHKQTNTFVQLESTNKTRWNLYTKIHTTKKTIRNESNLEDSVLSFLINPLTDARRQVKFCQKLIENLFEKGESPCTREFPEIKTKRQLLDHYLKGICSLTSQNGIHTIKIKSPNAFQDRYLIQTNDVDIEFLKVFTQYIIRIQYQNSQRARSMFTKWCLLTYL